MEDEEKEDVVQTLQTFGGLVSNYRTLAPEPPDPRQNWGVVPQPANTWSGVGSISNSGALPGVVVSNSTQATSFSARELLAQ